MFVTLKRLAALEGDYRVYPGHGPDTTLSRERRTNPYVKHAVSL
jgi:glyoxylase-like metal-dependent hydrolase (beta-lactamase superfamily II)